MTSDDEPAFTREQMKDWSRRQLIDTALAAMACQRLLLAENAMLELKIARQQDGLDAEARVASRLQDDLIRAQEENGLLAWENEIYQDQVDQLRTCLDGYREQERFHEGSVIQRLLSEAYAILGPATAKKEE